MCDTISRGFVMTSDCGILPDLVHVHQSVDVERIFKIQHKNRTIVADMPKQQCDFKPVTAPTAGRFLVGQNGLIEIVCLQPCKYKTLTGYRFNVEPAPQNAVRQLVLYLLKLIMLLMGGPFLCFWISTLPQHFHS